MHFLKVNSTQSHTEAVRNSMRMLAEHRICPTLGSYAKSNREIFKIVQIPGTLSKSAVSSKVQTTDDVTTGGLRGPLETALVMFLMTTLAQENRLYSLCIWALQSWKIEGVALSASSSVWTFSWCGCVRRWDKECNENHMWLCLSGAQSCLQGSSTQFKNQ